MVYEFPEYPKIYGPYEREISGPNRNRVIPGRWSRPEFEALADTPWVWTEKVDGTNTRIGWNGHAVEFGGRTGNAQIPVKLLNHLQTVFTEELFEQVFQDTPVVLYGEGYGAGIQKGGGNYAATARFVLFDVRIGGFWLLRKDVTEIAMGLGIGVVPEVFTGTVADAITTVRHGLPSAWGEGDDGSVFQAEGLVGVPVPGFLDRAGRRIMMKVKTADYGPSAPTLLTVVPDAGEQAA